jgi:hypothetical protein
MWKEDQERLLQKQRRILDIQSLPQRVKLLPWEDLGSFLSRTARKMGYEKPEWLLRLQGVPHKIIPDNLPLLCRQMDYLLLRQLLLRDEKAIYDLTLHRFARRLSRKVLLLSDLPGEQEKSINRPALPYDYQRLCFLSGRNTRVCPLCLDEKNGYDRLYWRCTLMLYCPRHRVLLIHACPVCKKPIPTLRLSPTLCPVCKTGDYRTDLYPLLPDDEWLEPGHRRLLRYLGVDESEAGMMLKSSEEMALDRMRPPDYFELHSICSTFLSLSALGEESSMRFLKSELRLKMLERRFLQSLRITSYEIESPVWIHYLTSTWPLHILAFLKSLQCLLQEVLHYAPDSGLVYLWSQTIVKGNFWCSLHYQQRPLSQMRKLYRVCEKRFTYLPSSEREEDYHGGEIVNERLILTRENIVTPLKDPLLPGEWESLTSFMARVADAMGYRRTEGLWKKPPSGIERYNMPENVLCLERNDDFSFLQKVLRLNDSTLRALTLHCLAPRLESQTQSVVSPSSWSGSERPFLSGEAIARHLLPTLATKVCPACLEQDGDERLYWHVRWVLVCPHHHLLLVNRCPHFYWHIPAIRRTRIWECPYCSHGDYRTAKRVMLEQNSLLYGSQHIVLSELGVNVQQHSQVVPALFRDTPLESLQPWEYFDILYCFSPLYRYLRPEKTLLSLCRRLGLPDERSLYQRLEDARTAMQTTLFHTLFLSWPDQLYAMVQEGLPPGRSLQQYRDLRLILAFQQSFSLVGNLKA